MEHFSVKLSGLSQRIKEEKRMIQQLDGIEADIRSVRSSLGFKVSNRANLSNILRNLERDVGSYEADMEMMRFVLQNVRDEYEKAEKRICEKKNDYTQSEYVKLDEYKNIPTDGHINLNAGQSAEVEEQLNIDYDWKDVVKSFGSAGKIYGIADSALEAESWDDWGNIGISTTKAVSSIVKDYKRYSKISTAIGTPNATKYFLRNFFGFNKVGHVSTASSASVRFYNNLHNTTSPYKLNGTFDAFTGKKGVVSSAAAWAGVALSGVSNAFDNIEEQKESDGTMSTGRVIAETVTETAIDTVITYAGSAVVGAAIATVTGAVAAPVVVAAATGLVVAGINAGCEAIFGVSATEAISDFALDTISAVGSAVADGAKAVANWFGKLSFA